MTYFAPYCDENGLHLPTYNDILEKELMIQKPFLDKIFILQTTLPITRYWQMRH